MNITFDLNLVVLWVGLVAAAAALVLVVVRWLNGAGGVQAAVRVIIGAIVLSISAALFRAFRGSPERYSAFGDKLSHWVLKEDYDKFYGDKSKSGLNLDGAVKAARANNKGFELEDCKTCPVEVRAKCEGKITSMISDKIKALESSVKSMYPEVEELRSTVCLDMDNKRVELELMFCHEGGQWDKSHKDKISGVVNEWVHTIPLSASVSVGEGVRPGSGNNED